MFCEAYNQSLMDAAAAGELSPALQQHLASCDSCRSAFANEQSLFAAIDSGLRAAANSEVPATLIPRVHVALNNEPLPQRNFQKWIFAGAALACALVVAITLQIRHRDAPVPVKTATAQPPAPLSPQLDASRPSTIPAAHEISPQRDKAETVESGSMEKTAIAAEILVPDEERDAFSKFLTRDRAQPAKSSAVVLLVPEAPKDLTPLPPVEIASLRVLPLSGEEETHGDF